MANRKSSLLLCATSVSLCLCGSGSSPAGAEAKAAGPGLLFCCRPDNDLYAAYRRAAGAAPPRFDTPEKAVASAPEGAGVLLLADGYPERPTPLDAGLFEKAARKRLRLYVEYPSFLPGREAGPPRDVGWERAVVATEAFGRALPRLQILGVNGCRFVPVAAERARVVLARVAGSGTALFGLPKTTFPLLFEDSPGVLVATTKLSQFVTARYGPVPAWRALWRWILDWLEPGGKAHALRWTPAVRPSYGRAQKLPAGAELRALRRGVAWLFNARMLVDASWQSVYDRDAQAWPDRVGPMPGAARRSGDGSLGVLEGFSSSIRFDGTQPARWWRRNDCNGETAGALALAARVLRDPALAKAAGNIGDWLYFRSILSQGRRADPKDPAYGLIGWNDIARYYGSLDGYGVYYGDDDARSMLGMMLAAACLKTDRWNERLAKCLLANLRLTGRTGFQPDRVDEGPLEKGGWQSFFRSNAVSYSPHYQGYWWSCCMWAYRQSGERLFLDRAKTAIRMTMRAYPDRWQCANGSLSLERARFLLPLAWLVRVENTPEHRQWLRRIAADLAATQDASGAIREILAHPDTGVPTSNEAYGTTETSLIQVNGDTIADMLYTVNFAFLGLHEAAAATGDPFYRETEDRIARFLCRIQARSQTHPEFDGVWFRAFDFGRWEQWASNADVGWGAWAVETGWTQSWITAVLALREMGTSLWELTANPAIRAPLQALRPAMIPDDLIASLRPPTVRDGSSPTR
jgi:hypothetical protein